MDQGTIQNYILRSWSLVKMGTTLNQRKLFFNLPKVKRRLSALEEGDLRPDHITLIAKELGVTEKEVVEMNCRLSGDVSLNAPLNEDGNSVEWQDRLVDEGSDQESCVAESEKSETRRRALRLALAVLDDRERQIFEARRLVDPPSRSRSSRRSFASRESGSGRSKVVPFKRCGGRCMGRCRGHGIL